MMRLTTCWIAAGLLGACSGKGPDGPGPSPYERDDELRLNHVQAKGTHNSYHQEPDRPADDSHRYTHAPLDVQLAEQGVRQFELDLHYRDGEGFEIFHLPLLDEVTSCRRFVDCLALIKGWSDANPWHLPILIWLEPKDDVDVLDDSLLPFSDRYPELEAEILSVWPAGRILMPDEVRGPHADLPTAIASDGWPTLGELRGRIMFSLLDGGEHRDAYTAGAANLDGKLMFVHSSSPADPFAAMFKLNDAQGGAAEVIERVQAGFIVTSNVAGAGSSATDNASKLADSLAAGFHYGSTDFPAPVAGYDFWFEMPAGNPARCNPIFPADSCTPADIEALP